MATYMAIPQNRVTVDGVSFDNFALTGRVARFENGFDIATVSFSDAKAANRDTIAADAAIQVQVKDASDDAYTSLLTGVVRYATETVNPEAITVKADAAGYMLAECLVGQEYGTQSNNPTLDTLEEIVEDAGAGIVPKWVEKVLNTAVASGYSLDTTKVDTIAGSINYLYFPFKPASKCLADICSIVQAINGAAAGPHWIVTTDAGTNYLRVKLVSGTQAGWTKYYGDSQANATLTQGVDFTQFTPETLSPEANYVLYHSAWLWPGNKDYATETGVWGDDAFTSTAYDAVTYKVGAKSLAATVDNGQVFNNFYYPDSKDLALMLDHAGGTYNIPTFNFWAQRNATLNSQYLWVQFNTGAATFFAAYVDLHILLPDEDKWQFLSFPVGPYWRNEDVGGPFLGIDDAGGDWNEVNYINFALVSPPTNSVLYVDGMHFAGYVLRGAYNSTLIADGLKTRFINDPFGKDDSLVADDVTGTIARLAYAELLRLQSTPSIGTLTTPMINNLLPGQLVHIHARPNAAGVFQIDADYRVTQLVQRFSVDGYFTDMVVTSDVTNSQARAAYDSLNETYKNIRPEFQDRQTTGIKMRDVDITQPILGHDYA